MQIFITANSPGELSGWVSPVVRELKARDASVRVTLVITPCQYASGMEADFARRQPGIDRVVTLKDLLPELCKKTSRRDSPEARRVLFLGGDTFYAALIAKRLKAPLFGYVSKVRRVRDFTMFFIPDERTRDASIKRGALPSQLTVAGHLCLDSIEINSGREEILRRLTGSEDSTVVTFLPGSRPAYIEYMLPFMLHSAGQLWEMRGDIRPVVALSPFADRGHILRILENEGFESEPGGDFCDVVMKSGCRVRIACRNPHEAIFVSSLAVTIPGTNNLQTAGMHVPMIVVVPLNKAEHIPLDGLAGFIFPRVYPLGLIKRNIFLKMNRRVKYVSLPNMIAGREIVPEVRGILRPRGVAAVAADMLRHPERRVQIARELAEITKQRGTAGIIAEALLCYTM